MINKYHAKKINTPDGVFASQKEYNRWCELKLMQRGHVITDLERQVSFELIPAQYETVPQYTPVNHIRKQDKRICVERSVNYVADFVYKKGTETVVEDTKGFKTPVYIIKRKLMLAVHRIRIQEV